LTADKLRRPAAINAAQSLNLRTRRPNEPCGRGGPKTDPLRQAIARFATVAF